MTSMTLPSEDVRAVAAGLSETQRRAVLDSPKIYRVSLHTRLSTLGVLERLGITEGQTSLILTPLGLAVRAHLEQQEADK